MRIPFFVVVRRKYLPILKKYPPKYIYEPWTAPLSVQRTAGCVIGTDYPRPIVDHKEAVKTNIARMKKARVDHYGDTAMDEGNKFVIRNCGYNFHQIINHYSAQACVISSYTSLTRP